MTNLDELFSDFDSRKRIELDVAANEQEQHKSRVVKAKRVLSSIVLPVVEEYAEEIRRQGHAVEIKNRLNDVSNPSLCLDFLPKVKHLTIPASSLFFSFSGNDVLVKRSIRDLQNSSANYTSEIKWNVDEVSAMAIREQVTSFIKAVLDAN